MNNNQFMLENLNRQRERLDEMIRNYQSQTQQQPVNNFINTNQPQMMPRDVIEWRVLNENEEVDNLYVQNDTLFVGEELMVKKKVDGTLEKWKVTKIYPIDKKDEKINQLEEEIKKLKEMINNEHKKSDESVKCIEQSDVVNDVNVESKSKTTSKSVSK